MNPRVKVNEPMIRFKEEMTMRGESEKRREFFGTDIYSIHF